MQVVHHKCILLGKYLWYVCVIFDTVLNGELSLQGYTWLRDEQVNHDTWHPCPVMCLCAQT